MQAAIRFERERSWLSATEIRARTNLGVAELEISEAQEAIRRVSQEQRELEAARRKAEQDLQAARFEARCSVWVSSLVAALPQPQRT